MRGQHTHVGPTWGMHEIWGLFGVVLVWFDRWPRLGQTDPVGQHLSVARSRVRSCGQGRTRGDDEPRTEPCHDVDQHTAPTLVVHTNFGEAMSALKSMRI